jgi:glycosyltransferase involved in cell wall biosynthesis
MDDEKPVVSIGMPVRNEAEWIQQSLDSLLGQTFSDFELIISDNASTDGTLEILQEYAATDPRIFLYRQSENHGARANFRFVLDQARGEYFMWAGGHDLWSADFLEILVGEMQANSDVVLCAPHGILVDEENKPIRSFDDSIDTRTSKSAASRVLALRRRLGRGGAFYGLHRRHVLVQTLPWPKVVASDNIILVRMASTGHIVTNQTAQWFRRRNRPEIGRRANWRRANALGLSGLAARFPYIMSRAAMMIEFSRAKGSCRERIALLAYGFETLFLMPSQCRLLVKELLSGILTLICCRFRKLGTEKADNCLGN